MKGKSVDAAALIADYSFIVRFVMLALIWAFVAFEFKILMNLSISGVILSLLFFAANITVFIGYKTRLSMALLAAVIFARGYLDHNGNSMGAAALTLLTVALPIGRYYSLDRYLELRTAPTPYQPSAEGQAKPLALGWKIMFLIFAANAIGGPIYNQVFHHNNRYILSWHMFHRKGRNVVQVEFSHLRGGKPVPFDYIKGLGIELKRPETRHNKRNDDVLIVGIPHLQDVISRLCATDKDPANLRVKARLATLERGWYPLYAGTEPLCTSAGEVLPRRFPDIQTDRTYPPGEADVGEF